MLARLALLLALLITPQARADWHLGVEALTDLPVQVGGRVAVEGPGRLRLSTSLGVLPAAYVDLINAIATSAGWYTDTTADLIDGALKNSLVWRTHMGWRPFPDLGFTIDAGYGLVTLGGGLTSEAILGASTGAEIPSGGDNRSYSVASALHMVDVEIGWEWFVWEGLWIRTALGGSFTAGSSTSVEPDFSPSGAAAARAVDAFARYSEDYLDDTYTSYVHTVVLTVGVGYRFF